MRSSGGLRATVAAPAAAAGTRDPLSGDHDSELVRIDNALLLTELATPAGRSLLLRSATECSRPSTTACPTPPRQALALGAVSITGIYVFESGPPQAFRLLLRSPADVVSWPRLRGGRPGIPWCSALFLAATVLAGLIWARVIANRNALVRQQVPRHHRRAEPPGERTARYARTRPGRHPAAARRRRPGVSIHRRRWPDGP